ncbi:MAG TPA: hypothetical protein VGP09_04425 [Caballeronia sp.]|jgi:hypothetical protein|nr:hypothetical protein [Caballeronia sp.]
MPARNWISASDPVAQAVTAARATSSTSRPASKIKPAIKSTKTLAAAARIDPVVAKDPEWQTF